MDPLITPSLLWAIGGGIFGGGVAWGAARNKIHHIQDQHGDLRAEFVAHKRDDLTIHRQLLQRTASTEAKVDIILKEVQRGR